MVGILRQALAAWAGSEIVSRKRLGINLRSTCSCGARSAPSRDRCALTPLTWRFHGSSRTIVYWNDTASRRAAGAVRHSSHATCDGRRGINLRVVCFVQRQTVSPRSLKPASHSPRGRILRGGTNWAPGPRRHGAPGPGGPRARARHPKKLQSRGIKPRARLLPFWFGVPDDRGDCHGY